MPEPLVINKNTDAIDPQRPFLGLRSFEEKNKSQFGGRDADLATLYDLVEDNGLTIVFGKSGIGKTSLLKAGLIPELEKNFYFPIYIRIDYSSVIPPLQQLKDFISQKIREKSKNAPDFGDRSLWKYFHEEKILDGLVTPVLIIDQFEEIFTLGTGKHKEVEEMMSELSDLAENRVPLEVQKDFQKKTETIESYYSEHHYRVIISLREDYLAQMESLNKYLPSIKNSRFRVVQMTVIQALDAAVKPSKGLIDKTVAIEIIKKLPGVTDKDFDEKLDANSKRLVVEPFLLSLICYQVNEKRIEKGQDKITKELVSEFDISNVISSFYNEAMKEHGENVEQGIEYTLLTETGYRKLESLEELQEIYKIDDSVIDALVEKRIIRKEEREGVTYIELIHDVLAPVIKQKRDIRIKAKMEQERHDALRRVEELNRKKTKRIVTIFVIITIFGLVFLSMIGYYAKIKKGESDRLSNLAFSNKLLVKSTSASLHYGDDTSSALISRSAYLFFKDNKGEDENPFYRSMFRILKGFDISGKSENFQFALRDSFETRALAVIHDDVYAAYTGGRIYKKSISNTNDSLHLFYDNESSAKIYSLSVNKDNTYLAAVGSFNYIRVIDLKKEVGESDSLTSPFINANRMNTGFTDKGNLILQTDSSIVDWEHHDNRWSTLKWEERKQVFIQDGKATAIDLKIKWNDSSLSIPGIKFNCMNIVKDNLLIGIDSGIVVITHNSLMLIKVPELNLTTTIAADSNMRYIYIGNALGQLCRFSLENYKFEINHNQVGRMYSLICSSDNKYAITGSADGTVGIFKLNIENIEWTYQIPLVLKYAECNEISRVYSIVFDNKTQMVFAGYENGNIYKWPVNCDLLSEMICNRIGTNSSEGWEQRYIINAPNNNKLEEKYFCK